MSKKIIGVETKLASRLPPVNVVHLIKNPTLALPHVSRRVFGREAAWVGQRGGNQGAVAATQLVCLLIEVVFRHGTYAVYSVTHFDGVKVDLHDALLAPNKLYEDGEVHLQSLAQPRSAGPQEHVLCRLLTDSAGAVLLLSALHVAFHSPLDSVEVEAVVLQEARVLTGHYGTWHVGRHLLQTHPTMVERREVAVGYLLSHTLKHERREEYGHELEEYDGEYRRGEKRHDNPFDNLPDEGKRKYVCFQLF